MTTQHKRRKHVDAASKLRSIHQGMNCFMSSLCTLRRLPRFHTSEVFEELQVSASSRPRDKEPLLWKSLPGALFYLGMHRNAKDSSRGRSWMFFLSSSVWDRFIIRRPDSSISWVFFFLWWVLSSCFSCCHVLLFCSCICSGFAAGAASYGCMTKCKPAI